MLGGLPVMVGVWLAVCSTKRRPNSKRICFFLVASFRICIESVLDGSRSLLVHLNLCSEIYKIS